MNQTIKTMLERRSVRKYKAMPVSDELLQTITNVGIWTMSGMNMQSVQLVVVRSPEMLARLVAVAEDFPNRGGNPFYGAPVVILAFAAQDACAPVQDASLALGNMANAAFSLGLGSCWINCVKDIFSQGEGETLRKELLPDMKYIPVGSLAVGYADEEPAPKPRIEGRCRFV